MRTTDRGASWQDVSPPGAAGLQFRDIEAFDANNAVAMSIGNNATDFPHLPHVERAGRHGASRSRTRTRERSTTA
jgi:hypothetical protein